MDLLKSINLVLLNQPNIPEMVRLTECTMCAWYLCVLLLARYMAYNMI